MEIFNMRCPDCSKFVSYGEPEIEIDDDSPELDLDNPSADIDVTIQLPCCDCGNTLKETTLTLEVDAGTEWCTCTHAYGESLPEWEWKDSLSAESTDRMQTTDRNGKPIKNARYMKHYYGASVSGVLECKGCGNTFEFSGDVEEQASAFDEVC